MAAFGEYVDDGTASTLKHRDYKDATDLVAGGFQIQAELIGRSPEAGPNGAGITDLETDPAYTLNIAGGVQGVVVSSSGKDTTGSLTTAFDSKNYSNIQEVSAGSLVAFAQNQRDEVRDLQDKAGTVSANPGVKQQTYVTQPTVRRLTPLECERLQGFPDNWTNIPNASDSARYKQMGNAVAVPVAQWILENIAVSQHPKHPKN